MAGELPLEAMELENIFITLEASVAPAIPAMLLVVSGVFHSICCCEARSSSWPRSEGVKEVEL